MSWWSWRRRRAEPIPPTVEEPTATAVAAAEVAHVGPIVSPDPWRPLAGEFALRLLTLTWEAVHHVGRAEEAERDPERQALLFRIDHTITRTRRLAENLRVLTGEPVEDPADRQAISLYDVARAAGSSAEHYERLSFGPIVDLAVAADAADDTIRVLTELIDNADRYSPPDQPVSVAAHLTGDGEVLVRVEDSGIGVPAERLESLNYLLSKHSQLRDADIQPSRVGLPVVAVLTRRHPGLQARLTPRSTGGTVAMLRIGADLVCEIPGTLPGQDQGPATGTGGSALPIPRQASSARFDPDRTAVLPIAIPMALGSRHTSATTDPGPTAGSPAAVEAPPLPRRTPGSIRVAEPQTPVTPPAAYRTTWHDDAEAFNAGVDAANRDTLTSSRKGPGA
ncbi:ATP-binding protein [Paractinoplanes ferrugineus]|uniref:histidine kinase n=1 Tax=Paractinoplanes ferrugineus TaxID=113564 RepID=A0A919MK00_9ACTN|nr:ATP-binding protein [Actinoplanes ferrugineus]GIE10682.1 histidine kinase [Actinoplanes ferrugineus]